MNLRSRLKRIESRLPKPDIEIIVRLVDGSPTPEEEEAILKGELIYVSDVDHDKFISQLIAKRS